MLQLYIGNKNYSSWSLRAWLLLRHSGIPFEEKRLRLDWDEGSPFKKTLRSLAPTGRVPLLIDDGFAVWDSLAIAEYVAELHPEKGLWPADRRRRARARSLCAEMHSGFAELRNTFGMNVEASLPEVGARMLAEKPKARGLAVPGMPAGSPGMEGSRKDPYAVLLVKDGGKSSVYKRYE